jgi:hypothetical protein
MKSPTARKIVAYLRALGAMAEANQIETEILEFERDQQALSDALCGLIRADKATWATRRDQALKTLITVGATCN